MRSINIVTGHPRCRHVLQNDMLQHQTRANSEATRKTPPTPFQLQGSASSPGPTGGMNLLLFP